MLEKCHHLNVLKRGEFSQDNESKNCSALAYADPKRTLQSESNFRWFLGGKYRNILFQTEGN